MTIRPLRAGEFSLNHFILLYTYYSDFTKKFIWFLKCVIFLSGILFVGSGVSGGEEGARYGPSLMPGGNPAAWPHLQPIFQVHFLISRIFSKIFVPYFVFTNFFLFFRPFVLRPMENLVVIG